MEKQNITASQDEEGAGKMSEIEVGDTVRVVCVWDMSLDRYVGKEGIVGELLSDGDMLVSFDIGRRRFEKRNVELVEKKKTVHNMTSEEKIAWLLEQVTALTMEVKSLKSQVDRIKWSGV